MDLESAWCDLFHRVRRVDTFRSYAWTAAFLETGAYTGRAQILTAWSGDRLVAVLPVAVQRRWGVRVARPIGDRMPSYLGVLVDPGCPEVVDRLADFVRENRLFDVFITNNCSSEDKAMQRFVECLSEQERLCATAHRNVCHVIELEGDFESYLSAHHLTRRCKKLRWERRRIVDKHDCTIQSFCGSEVTSEVLDRLAAIQQASWMRRRGAAVLGRPFYRHLIARLATAGLVRVWILNMEGQDVAFVCCLTAPDWWHLKWLAFKLSHASLSPGKVLMMHTIRSACEAGVERYDFGHGEAEYKRFWATEQHGVDRCAAGRGWRGRVAVAVYRCLWRAHEVSWLRSGYRQLRGCFRSGRKHLP